MKLKSKKSKIIIIVIILIIAIAIGYIIYEMNKSDDSKIYNTVSKEASVETRTITTSLTAPGEVQSATIENLSLTTSYYFSTLCVEEGEQVAEGSNLVKYTNGKYLVAPYDCVIEEVNVPTTGSICTTSNYIKIASIDDLYMDINIGEDQIDKVSVGQAVDIVVNYDESKTYSGSITKLNAVGTYSQGGTTFAAIASLENDGYLKIGMSATCTIKIESKDDLVCVPIEAVTIENDKRYVNKVVDSENGEVVKTEVETGSADANYVEITSGLSLGDIVSYDQTTVTETEDTNTTSDNALTSLFNMGGNKGRNRN